LVNASNITEHWLEDGASAALRAARCVAELLRQGIAVRGVAGMAVSGGRSPIAFFHELARQDLPWDKVSITLVDERWVSADSADSNEHLVREHLLRDAAAIAKFISLKTVAASPQDALAERETAISSMPWPLDAIVLGMGEDGHTASLFPDAKNLGTALDVTRPNLLAAIDPPHADHRRISLTLRALLQARCLVLLIQNPRKRAVYEQARITADVTKLPIAGVLNQRDVSVEVFWSS
jgi:6-phosphogluconolactonase